MPTTSDVPKPAIVLQQSSTTPPSVLTQEDVLKFSIGLRLLGKEKQQRYLSYLAAVQNQQTAKEE